MTPQGLQTQLERLCQQLVEQPNNLGLLDQAAAVASQLKLPEQAAELYRTYAHHHKQHAGAHFNCGYYLRVAGRYAEAIEYYRQALALGISQPEEVHTNIGVIYNEGLLDNQQAQQAFFQALKIAPNYVPALYNLANSYEQDGDKQHAAHYFNEVIKRHPDYAMAYVRLADVQKAERSDDALIRQLREFLESGKQPLNERIDIAFALGKLHDDCGSYDLAWQFYQQANTWNATTMPAWDVAQQEALLRTITEHYAAPVAVTGGVSQPKPLFICGMFRSGSTLLEQMLGAHDGVTSGGELEFFPRLWQQVQREGIAAFSQRTTVQDYAAIGQDYLDFVQQRFGSQGWVTDKRPDNIWLLGLIKRALPDAKFIVTRRQLLDNCLSVYFTRLGASMNYANSIEHIQAFLALEQQLLAHWQQVFGDDLHVVDYDALVVDPETELGRVLKWLELPWQEQCLAFHERTNAVRTASVWQVRQPLYKSSSGRWRNYQKFLK
ncbi:tetratricopeptide repeat-containing sulfotransferase family protein [Pseudidiomarina sp.]|uniref:tetratricopeptide repeat-containing sulfotransferase family protein n=1 Tax=Pseudidiomarina sp. TaxID=2081707 RepID=UPI003A9877FA